MYDVKPGSEGIPELAAHIAARRQRTLEAIKAGITGRHAVYADEIAEKVLASLEQMWRDDEVFT